MSETEARLELGEVFAGLEVRFISNLSEAEIARAERLFFHLEQAWWHYEDHIADQHKYLPHFKHFEDFARDFVRRSDHLRQFSRNFDTLYAAFKDYQHRIPVYGGALLTPDLQKVLLVTGFKQNSWGFPKGKINQNEDELVCALREVYEETGFDATYLNPRKEDNMMTSQKSGKFIKIFIIPGVPEDYPFAPRVVKEIDEIRWFRVDDLPGPKKMNDPSSKKSDKFWGVSMFVSRLKRWVAKKQNGVVGSLEDRDQLTDDQDEFPVDEMFRVNKLLRQRELQAAGGVNTSSAAESSGNDATNEDNEEEDDDEEEPSSALPVGATTQTCHYCRLSGHLRKNCPQLAKDTKAKASMKQASVTPKRQQQPQQQALHSGKKLAPKSSLRQVEETQVRSILSRNPKAVAEDGAFVIDFARVQRSMQPFLST